MQLCNIMYRGVYLRDLNDAIRRKSPFWCTGSMVICAVIGCSARSDREKDLSFFRLPMVTNHQGKNDYELGKNDYELRKKRLDGYLAAISREDINPNSQINSRP